MGSSFEEVSYLEVSRLVGRIGNFRDRLIFRVLLEGAVKVSELANLRVLDFVGYGVIVSGRFVSLSEDLLKEVRRFVLSEGKKRDDFLFSGRQSSKLTTRRMRQIVSGISFKFLGFKVLPEDIRKVSIGEKLKKKRSFEVRYEAGLKRFDCREYLRGREVSKLRREIDSERDKLIFDLLLSGYKSKQICNLRVCDVFKTKLSSSLKERLESYVRERKLSHKTFVFLTRQGSNLTKERIYQIIVSLGKDLGISVTPRVLNNTFLKGIVSLSDFENKLAEVGIKNTAFCLHGGFVNGG